MTPTRAWIQGRTTMAHRIRRIHRPLTMLAAAATLGGAVATLHAAAAQSAPAGPARGAIVTVAGGGVGDGRAATHGGPLAPAGVAAGAAGEMFRSEQAE